MTCTGFHRPNPIKNIIKNPIGSICANGFGVSLHCILGVGSPSLYDVQAWAYSCSPIDTARIMLMNIICVKSNDSIRNYNHIKKLLDSVFTKRLLRIPLLDIMYCYCFVFVRYCLVRKVYYVQSQGMPLVIKYFPCLCA